MSHGNCSSEFKRDKIPDRWATATRLSALPFKSHAQDQNPIFSIDNSFRQPEAS
jgi:hypothetical protein